MLMKGDIRGVFILGNQKKEKNKNLLMRRVFDLAYTSLLVKHHIVRKLFSHENEQASTPRGGGFFVLKK